ncbi:NAD(P)/FAD-dependent oxidoreductase [Kribbella antibiotica]|uniref:NAD(P)/FAD-dependent oxidoreductase n=1 Tax=Kribbella antibiotica TaxID=190195 RepID=A0A4R4ZR95_9ACTN|nr:NAD(P)/FAD-dependent oxidoreductase [Kribbella antibiotica]TDD61275.1 NAD(P)/FAD-dependent oxidoreductase [Kribbella antibiotica]
MYDIIVVGGRCAGASVALLAARAGLSVLVLERAAMPSDTVSTHLVHQPGAALLADWGVLDAVAASGCPPILRSGYRVGDIRLEGSARPFKGQQAAYAPRRNVLDGVLVDAAIAAGVEYRDQATVTGLLTEDGRVHGVRFRTPKGGVQTEECRLLVGADGMRSSVARFTGAAMASEDPTLTCVYYSYWAGLHDRFELFEAPGRFAGLVPTHDGRSVVSVYFPQSEFETVRRDSRRIYVENVAQLVPELADATVDDERFGKLYAIGDQRNFFRQGHGAGWVLIGDAWHHKDSITARGISDAFLQSDLFASTVLPKLPDPVELDAALATYDVLRGQELVESYRNTLSVAKLDLQEERLRLLRHVAADPALVQDYFTVVSGGLPVGEFYSAELLAEALN